MSIIRRVRKAIKSFAFGGTPVPQRVFLGQRSPQTEITVWLHGMGSPIDVTNRHAMACAVPFILCLPFDANEGPGEKEANHLSLKFCEQDGQRRVLGEIGLKLVQRVMLDGKEFILFGARGTANYCMSRLRLWAHYLLYERAERQAHNTPDITLTFRGRRAMEVMFICPRPISLVSVITDIKGNMFPVNVM